MIFKTSTLLLVLSICLAPGSSQKANKKSFSTNTKAASYQVSCGCQCSNLSFRDDWGKSHGNCKSADETGARWCYVDPYYSDCQDLGYSSRGGSYQNKKWSYQACDTPAISSPQCSAYGGGYGGNYGSGSVVCKGTKCGGGYNQGYNNGGYGSSGSYVTGGSGFNGGSGSYGGSGSNYNGGYGTGSYGGSGSNYNGGYGSGSSNCRGTNCGGSYGGTGSFGNSGSYVTGGSGFNSGSGSNSPYGGLFGSGSSGGYGDPRNSNSDIAIKSNNQKKDSVKFG